MRGFIRFGPKQLGWLAIAAVVALPAFQVDSASAQEKKYRFVMVSHIGSNDANMGWLTRSLKVFEEKYPDVETEYISTNQYSIQDHVRLLEQAIATNPDGLAVPIVSSEAFDGPLRKAIEKGIPVVAFNIPDQRPKEERIPYLTYVGGDEYLTGKLLGDYTVEHAKAGEVPVPTKVLCTFIDAAHQGQQARCQGFEDAMEAVDASFERLFIGADPARGRSILQAYLSTNKDTNYIYAGGWTVPWIWGAANDVGLSPDVDDKGITIVAQDAHPAVLAGIQRGHIFATNSQGFWLQGYLPMERLYWFHELGYTPMSDDLTGPIVIDASTVDKWERLTRDIFGDEYDTQVTW